jgi:hypothetical protein
VTQQRDAVVTRVATVDLFDALRVAWATVLGESAPRAALVLLTSQWALETGWGAHCYCFNLGNAKARPGGPTDWCYFPCDERMSPAAATHALTLDAAHAHLESATPGQDGLVPVWFDPPHPYACFAAYATLGDAAVAWLRMQHGTFGSAWPALLSGNARLFAQALAVARYYTAPPNRYATTLGAIAAQLDGTLPDFADTGPVDAHDTAPPTSGATTARP